MAAAIIPLVASAVAAIAPQIPSIVQLVEGLFGHSSQTGKQEGIAKLQAAVALLQQALTALANAGKIPSAPVIDPNTPAALAGAVQQAVDSLQKAGLLGPTQSLNTTNKSSWTITAVQHPGRCWPGYAIPRQAHRHI
jgi:hypothetical protein